jgi:twinkle protein
MERQVTIFKNITDSKNPYYPKLSKIVDRIKTGNVKDLIEKIRTIQDKKDRDKYKKQLPSICFSGLFTHRANDAVKKHTGLVAIDFDHLENYKDFRESIIKDKYTFIAFKSPSGDGLKVVVKIPANIKTHHLSCKALKVYYKTNKLDNFEDIARVCYESYDPDIFVNPKSDVFKTLAEEKKVKRLQVTGHETNYDIIFDNIVKWIERFESYTDGNKHKFLVKFAGACNRFGMPDYLAIQKLTFKYQNAASFVKSEDFENIVRKVYGSYSHQHNISYFEKTGIAYDTITKVKLEDNFFNEVTANSKDIVYLDNVRNSMIEGFKTGKAKGETTHFLEWDDCWKWRKKEVTFVGGIGNIGKSTWFYQLCLLKAVKDGQKFAVFSPEQEPADDFYNDLIHAYIGKSTEPYHTNQMTMEEYSKGMDFIKDHFFYIFPETESPTPEYINRCFEYLVEKKGVDGCIIDPFNQLDNDWRKYNRDDLYLSEFLGKEKRFAQKHNVYKIIIGHPVGNKLKKDSQGDYEKPNLYDYAGGSMWNNKCDNIIMYHRPFATSNPRSTTCEWTSQKIKKRKLVGIPGTIQMKFDVYTNRFTNMEGISPLDKNNPDQTDFDFSDVTDIDF